MERRVLVAIFLSFLVLYGYQAFIVKPVPKPLSGTSGASAGAIAGKAPSANGAQGTTTTAPTSTSTAHPMDLLSDKNLARYEHH